MMTPPPWLLLLAGIALVLVLADVSPRWGGWLLLILLLGYLFVGGGRRIFS